VKATELKLIFEQKLNAFAPKELLRRAIAVPSHQILEIDPDMGA
jgi:hypothetical protein